MKLVVDASVAAKIWVREPRSRKARTLIDSADRGNDLLVPWHMPAETMNALIKTRLVRNGAKQGVRPETLKRYVNSLMVLVRTGALQLFKDDNTIMFQALELALLDTGGQGHLSIYDTIYHALAIQEEAKFVTDDAAYVRKLQNHARLRASVVLLEDLEF